MGRLQRIEDNDTAFSGMVLRRPTPVTAPPTTINEGAQVSVPTVNPTVSVQPTEQQTASVVQQTGASATVPPVQRQAAPVQQSVPTRQGVTADPRTNPYEYIEQMYGPQETAEQRMERERREYNNQRIAGMLGLFTGIGNMLVTSGNRYGRAVESPDFAKAAQQGIATRALKRREEEKSRLDAVMKQQNLDMKREEMRRNADEKAWNRAYRLNKDAQDLRYKREKDAADLKYRQGKDEADRAFKKEAEANRNKLYSTRTAIMASRASRSGGRGSNNDYYDVSVPNYPNGIRVSKKSWNIGAKRRAYDMCAAEDPEWFKERGWLDRPDTEEKQGRKMTEQELEQAVVSYCNAHPDSNGTRSVTDMLIHMRDSDPHDNDNTEPDDPFAGDDGEDEGEDGATYTIKRK